MMKKTVRNGLSAAVLTAMIFLLVSCGDLSMLMAQLDDDVKLANDRYLEVVETFPEQNDQNLSPKIELLVSLDRDVDPEVLRKYLLVEQRNADGTITEFGDSTDVTEELDIEFSSSDKTLSIRPSPFWAGGDKITVSLLPGAMALDGSVLRSLYSWSFYTVKVPLGLIDIVDGPSAQPGYSPTATPNINIAFSNAGEYFLDTDKALIDAAKYDTWTSWVSTSVKSGEELPAPGVFPDFGEANLSVLPQGANTIYALFKDPSTNTVSDLVSDTVFVDTVNPSVGALSSLVGPTNTPFDKTGTASDSDSGLLKTEWKSSPTGLVFGAVNALTTTISGLAIDQEYTVTLEATDLAGRVGSSSFSLDWDKLAPTAPAFTGIPSNTSTTVNTPTWSWKDSASIDALTTFSYRLDSNSWVENSSATSYTASALPDGLHYFYVGQYDDVGNFGSRYDSCIINIAKISPYNSQRYVSTATTLAWQAVKGSTYTYSVYEEAGRFDPFITSGSTGTSGVTPSLSKNLDGSTTYKWYYYSTVFLGKPVEHGPYYFTTTK